MDVVLGFDTSCYTTSVAAVDRAGRVIASERMLLPVQSGQRGLRQSEAVFAHVRQMPLVTARAGQALAGANILAVAASEFPRAEEGSYMPVFTVGAGHAHTVANILNVQYYAVSHQQGHIAAGQLEMPPMEDSFTALHLSGGTTELLLWEKGELTALGGSLDLHAGQLVDRVGVAMGLPFPAGPALEALAIANREPAEALLPASMEHDDMDCHLSGAEAQCERWIKRGTYARERIAAEVFDLLARTVARLLAAGCKAAGTPQALVVGGVATSMLLRTLTQKRLMKMHGGIDLRFGKPEYSGDNAAGVAWLGMQRYCRD